jgi:uncharacterized protein with HEPN domain
MARDPRAYLWDVREAALAIQSFTAGMDAEGFAVHPMAQASVERKFEIIGEALNQLSRLEPALAGRIPELPRIVAFRNLLIHSYAAVDVGTVWNTVQRSLPGLMAKVQELLDELG